MEKCMTKRNFNSWLMTMRDSIATWNYYTDFAKVYENINKVKVELNILNALINSKTIEEDFRNIVTEYPRVLKVIPILLAKREHQIKINDAEQGELNFNFDKPNYNTEQYIKFLRETGIFDLLEHHLINNVVDYVTGIEVGMDTNGRKNRTGHVMEDLVENYLIKAGLVKGETYFKETYKSEIEKRFGLNLDAISNQGKTEKRFDFVIYNKGHVYACECNFYGSNGSKLNETARSYKNITLEAKEIDNFSFVWFTDGIGWHGARHNLEETFDVLDTLYNLSDLESGCLNDLLK